MPRPPGTWTRTELEADAQQARAEFVKQRLAALQTEQRTHAAAHREAATAVEALLKRTGDLRAMTGASIQDRAALGLARQLAVPPISVDDLDTLTDSSFGQWLGQTTDRGARPTDAAFAAAAKIIGERLDTDRMPWVAADRSPSRAERQLFIEWTATGPATARVLTARRNEASARQEDATRAAAGAAGYDPVRPPGALADPINEMPPGSFSVASRKLGGTNMDVPVRLRADHPTGLLFLAIECKVSNSSLNSRKRLIEVTRKREVWDSSGALYRFRTAAVLSGVFSVERLQEAQDSGVLLLWEHRLSDLTAFL